MIVQVRQLTEELMDDAMEDLEVIYEIAKKHMDEGHYAEAARLYRQIGELELRDEKCVVFYLLAAKAFVEANMLSEAIANCHTALEIDRSSAMAWQSLGRALIADQQDDEAELALMKSLELSPSVTANIYLADLCIRHGRPNDGERFCRQALELDPDFDEAYYNLGRALREQDRLNEAIEAFLTALKLSPDYSLAYFKIGAAFLEAGDAEKGVEHIRKGLKYDPANDQAQELLKRALAVRGGDK